MPLLERDSDLELLRGAVVEAAARRGSSVLVSGDAGIGKSTLLTTFADDPGSDARVLVGWCDDLLTSRTYGPLRDVARRVGGELTDAIAAADTAAVMEAVFALLDDPLRPTVLILEDLHWADEATLDIVRLVGRRIGDRPAVMVLSYRDSDLGADHPLRSVLAALSARSVRRLHLRPLSRHAVADLVAGTGLDPAEVTRLTGGNPFFVSEIAAQGSLQASVTDAVVGRLQALSPEALAAVELLSVIPRAMPRDDVLEIVGDAAVLAEAEARGILVAEHDSVGFRHELARRAVSSSLPVTTRVRHHDRVLAHLLARGSDPPDVVHHAVGAGRAEVVASHGPAAVQQAFGAGANREAVAYAQQVLHYGHLLEHEQRADVLLAQTWAAYALGRFTQARAASETALEIRSRTGPVDARARAITAAARMAYTTNDPDRVWELLALAKALEADLEDPEVAAEVAVNRAALSQLMGRFDEAFAAADAATELLDRLDRPDLRALVAMYRGGSRLAQGDLGGLDEIRSVLTTTEVSTLTIEPIGRAYTNLIASLVELRRWDEALRTIDEGLAYFDDHDLDGARYNVLGTLAWLHLFQGRWDEATELLRSITASEQGIFKVGSLAAEALIATRRGEADARQRVQQAWEPARRSGTPWLVVPIASGAAELAWAIEDPSWAEPFLTTALETDDVRWRDWLLWRTHVLLGRDVDAGDMLPSAERTSVEQGWERGAEAWAEAGMPYERALDLIRSREVEPTREGLAILDLLGAEPAAAIARQRLRALGVSRVPRGPQASTRENPMGLTDRQLEVLELLAEGLTNAEIAERLVVSVRTVDHHVSAVLRKLGVSSRQDAADVAVTLSDG